MGNDSCKIFGTRGGNTLLLSNVMVSIVVTGLLSKGNHLNNKCTMPMTSYNVHHIRCIIHCVWCHMVFHVAMANFPYDTLMIRFTSTLMNDWNLNEIHANYQNQVSYIPHPNNCVMKYWHGWLKFGQDVPLGKWVLQHCKSLMPDFLCKEWGMVLGLCQVTLHGQFTISVEQDN